MLSDECPVSVADREEVLAAARDYIESWLDGDAPRMAGCLHPELVKRETGRDPQTGQWVVETLTREDMVAATAAGRGRRYARPYEATVLDAYGDIATVAVLSSPYLDYLHVLRTNDRWQIVNVLWQRRPGR